MLLTPGFSKPICHRATPVPRKFGAKMRFFRRSGKRLTPLWELSLSSLANLHATAPPNPSGQVRRCRRFCHLVENLPSGSAVHKINRRKISGIFPTRLRGNPLYRERLPDSRLDFAVKVNEILSVRQLRQSVKVGTLNPEFLIFS